MTLQERSELFEDICRDCQSILNGKGEDYAGNDDANRNFKQVGYTLGLTQFQTWAVYFNKHVDAVNNAIKKNPDYPERKAESIRESLHDIINYAVIMESLLVDIERETKSTPPFAENETGFDVPIGNPPYMTPPHILEYMKKGGTQ